ncbi:YcxB family protein [Methylocaldum szegediense]|uniref:YcxB domain-containing protein n=1 Tax=Methylocaldum szegediense TaxID=73780 RepID=A0ABM9I1L3_9GAMM|nr:YcxB family protein [Methylocaldum szegediense]CAI8831362.1 YcxB domain-containing protein [Methylocaldum szegediense]
MAQIEYEVREQDLVAFNEHQLRNSASWQKTLRRHQAIFPGIIVLISLFLWFYYQDTLAAIYAGVTGVLWGIFAPLYFKGSLRRQLRKMYSDEDRANVLGTYTLRAEPHVLVEVHKNGESRVKWSEVLRVETTKKHAFLFVDLDTALIIPKATVKKGDLQAFIKEADKRIDQAA